MHLRGNSLYTGEPEFRGDPDWLAAQAEALQAVFNGASLDASLGILIRAAMKQTAGDARCAVYIADGVAADPLHVSRMSNGYARHLAGFKIPESPACGPAACTGKPIIMPDVTKEPAATDWLRLAKKHDYRGCWSFPVVISTGEVIGTCTIYFREPRQPTTRDWQVAAALTGSVANIISRHKTIEERRETEHALKRILAIGDRRKRSGNKVRSSLEAILEEALFITGAPRGNLQLLEGGKALRIAAHRGFKRPFLKFFDTVTDTESSACGAAFRQGGQVVVEDITSSALFLETPALEVLRAAQVGAVISTPFTSSAGAVMGVISTHFPKPYKPREQSLRLLRLLARQAARCCQESGG